MKTKPADVALFAAKLAAVTAAAWATMFLITTARHGM